MHVTMHVSMMRGYPGRDRGEEEEGLLQQFYKVRIAEGLAVALDNRALQYTGKNEWN